MKQGYLQAFPGRDSDQRTVLPCKWDAAAGLLQPEALAILPEELLGLAVGVVAELHINKPRWLHEVDPPFCALVSLGAFGALVRDDVLDFFREK